jgi:hypothetical protein
MASTLYQKLSRTCDGFFYSPFSGNWRFKGDLKQKSRQDQLADNLRRHGLTPAYVNATLADRGIDETFQSLVKNDQTIIDRAIASVDIMEGYPHHRVFLAQEKRDYIFEEILRGLPNPRQYRFNHLRELLFLAS